MKKLLLLASFMFAAAATFAQGVASVTWQNTTTTLITNSSTGLPIQGVYTFQLWIGPAGSSSYSSMSPAVSTNGSLVTASTTAATSAGRYFTGGNAYLPTAPGTYALGVRAWAGDNTLDYATAASKGQTAIVNYTTGDPANNILPGALFQADTAGKLSGFVIGVVPEPSSIALGLLGLGAVALFRRRK